MGNPNSARNSETIFSKQITSSLLSYRDSLERFHLHTLLFNVFFSDIEPYYNRFSTLSQGEEFRIF